MLMKHWVFDLDGTLVDSFDFFLDFAKAEFQKNDLEFTPQHSIEGLGSPALRFLQKYLGADRGADALNRLRTQSYDDARHIRPFPGVIRFLEHLQRHGSKIAVWTSRDRSTTEHVLHHAGLAPFMQMVQTGCCVTQHKPNPEGMLAILNAFDCLPADVTMVGDHDVDMLAAKASGVRAIRAAWHRHSPQLSCDVADGVLHKVEHLHQWGPSPGSAGGNGIGALAVCASAALAAPQVVARSGG